MFSDIVKGGRFSEPLVRYFGKQLLTAIHYLHSNGYAHNDLKLENLLLDAKFNIKIADFGFASKISGRDGSGFII